MIEYRFNFAIPPKERERSRAIKRGNKWTATVYSPQSTIKFYLKIRTYILNKYPDYIKNKIDYDCKLTLIVGVIKKNANNDLDNRIKNLDAFNKDNKRKNNTGFKGLWTDDKVIKNIEAKIVYVDKVEEEFSIVKIEPYEVETLNEFLS